jgi:hypothetical protein
MDSTFDTTDCKPLTEGREKERKEKTKYKNIAMKKKNQKGSEIINKKTHK